MNAITHETQEQLGPATVGGLAKPAFDGAVRLRFVDQTLGCRHRNSRALGDDGA
jgi:hypothetical protein